MVEAMDRRAAAHGFHHVADPCRASVEISRTIYPSPGPPDPSDVQLLNHTGQAIRVALYPTEHAPAIAHEISEVVTAR